MGRRFLRGVAVFAIWMLIWQIIYMAVGQDLLVAAPGQVALRLAELAGDSGFWLSVAASLLRILAGYGAAVLVGTLLAVFTAGAPLAHAFFSPLLGVIRATPVASFIILALIWMATGMVPVFISFLMVLPVVWANVAEGVASVDGGLLEMGRVFGMGRAVRLRRIYAPSVAPYFSAAATTSMGLAWKAGVAAEVLCRPELSIGDRLHASKIYLETTDLFAWTAVVIFLSFLLERAFALGMRRAAARLNGSGR